MKTKFPCFNDFVCIGDSISWSYEGFDFVATLEYDQNSKPTDFDCYSPQQINRWKRDEWFFVGIVLSVSKNDMLLSDHIYSVWGFEANISKKKGGNIYLSVVVQEMQDELICESKQLVTRMIHKLTM